MIKSKFALIFDSIILTLIINFLFFVWIRNLFKNANLFYFFLILILLLSFTAILNLLLKINNKKLFKRNNENYLNSCLNYLIICPFLEYKNFICKLLNCTHIDNFLFQINDKFIFINLKTEITPEDYFTTQEILFKQTNNSSTIYFIYKTKSKSFDEICNLSQFNISLFDFNIILKLMKTKNMYPIKKDELKKTPFKLRLNNFIKQKTQGITNKHFKEFFFSGISLLFLSLIVPFSNLYLITGSILLIISIITFFKKNYTKENSDSDILFK